MRPLRHATPFHYVARAERGPASKPGRVDSQLVSPKERLYFTIGLTLSILVYLALLVTLVGFVYIPAGVVALMMTQGLLLGRLRGNAVRVGPQQFPALFATAERLAASMGLATTPAIYLVQEGGFLNAFATRFIGRDFMIVYSELYACAKHQGEDEIAFVVAHEMAHLKRRHTLRAALLWPATLIPFFGPAYSRACEYTADAMGAYHAPAGAARGILLLASGKELFHDVDGNEFLRQSIDDRDFFVWLAEKLASHPTLPNRLVAIARLLNDGLTVRTAAEPGGAVAIAAGTN